MKESSYRGEGAPLGPAHGIDATAEELVGRRGKGSFRLGEDKTIDITRSRGLLALSPRNRSSFTRIRLKDREPVMDDQGVNKYPYTQFDVSRLGSNVTVRKSEGKTSGNVMDVIEELSNSAASMQQELDGGPLAIGMADLARTKASQDDLQVLLIQLQNLSPEDLLDKYGRTQVEQQEDEEVVTQVRGEIKRIYTKAKKDRHLLITRVGTTKRTALYQKDGDGHKVAFETYENYLTRKEQYTDIRVDLESYEDDQGRTVTPVKIFKITPDNTIQSNYDIIVRDESGEFIDTPEQQKVQQRNWQNSLLNPTLASPEEVFLLLDTLASIGKTEKQETNKELPSSETTEPALPTGPGEQILFTSDEPEVGGNYNKSIEDQEKGPDDPDQTKGTNNGKSK